MFRRRNYFIKKRFQAKFFLRFGVLVILEALLITGLFMYISSNTLTTGYFGNELIIKPTASFFLVTFIIISLIIGTVIALAGMVVFIFFSHRIAGPLYRFEKSLDEIAGGNLGLRIELRSTDQLVELQEALNRFMQRMDERISAIKKDIEELSGIIPDIDKPEIKTRLKQVLVELKTKIENFKTSKI